MVDPLTDVPLTDVPPMDVPLIDVHSHVVPSELPFGLTGDERWPTVEVEGDRGRVLIAGKLFRVIRRQAWDLEVRMEETETTMGITTQVLSPMPELFSYWAPPPEAARFCREINQWIGNAARQHPNRFHGLGIVPLQDPELAAGMLEQVKADGLCGVEIGTNINGVSAADARYVAFYQEAARLGLGVFIHAYHPPFESAVPGGRPGAAVNFPVDVTFCTQALIVNGILEAVAGARIGISHGGGGACFTLPRLENVWEDDASLRERLPHPPRWYMRQMYFDTLLFGLEPLRYLIDVVGADRVFVGTDYPFGGSTPAGWDVGGEGFDARTRALVRDANARRFLGLQPEAASIGAAAAGESERSS